MDSFLKRRKRSFIDKNNSPNNIFPRFKRYSLSTYLKFGIFILILYYLNILIGFKSYIWYEKSFENEYYLTMTHIDITNAEENPLEVLGPPKNILSNQFLIENEYLCGRSPDPETRIYPHLIILIKSSCENFKERQAIRLTWGEKNHLLKHDIRLAFVLGTSAHNINVKDESKKYGDIIQIDKMDYYYYSSYKMVMMLRWINDYCSTKSRKSSFMDLRRYVLFVEDDYYIDIQSLLDYIRTIDDDHEMTTYERRTFITGELIENSRPHRFVNDRWYVSIVDYPYDRYPSYISSGCFLMTRYNSRLFYIASKYTRLFNFDDIYMGLLSYSMSINLIRNNELFSTSLSKKFNLDNQTEILSRWKKVFNKKLILNSTKKSICFHGYRTDKLISIWNQIHQTNLTFSFD